MQNCESTQSIVGMVGRLGDTTSSINCSPIEIFSLPFLGGKICGGVLLPYRRVDTSSAKFDV